MRLGIEKEISPEKLQGRPFQQPIIKPRFGSGFEIQGLALPIGWEKGVNPLIDNPATFNEGYFRAMLKRYYFPEEIEGKVVMDDNINLPSFISISTTPESYLILSKEPGNESSGCYISNTTNLEAAFALIQAVSFFLDDARKQLEDENNKISYVERYENQFEPRNLGFRSDSIPLSSNEQERFTEEAKKIATDFGLEIFTPEFEEGFLRWVQIKGTDRVEYGLGESLGQFRYFFAHNVETPQQAASLHAVVSSFINCLLGSQPASSLPSQI